jgi:hypothetical protein
MPLGDYTVNGDYAPHLHFQIIDNIGDHLVILVFVVYQILIYLIVPILTYY